MKYDTSLGTVIIFALYITAHILDHMHRYMAHLTLIFELNKDWHKHPNRYFRIGSQISFFEEICILSIYIRTYSQN